MKKPYSAINYIQIDKQDATQIEGKISCSAVLNKETNEVTFVPYNNLNHIFTPILTGSVADILTMGETFSEIELFERLDLISFKPNRIESNISELPNLAHTVVSLVTDEDYILKDNSLGVLNTVVLDDTDILANLLLSFTENLNEEKVKITFDSVTFMDNGEMTPEDKEATDNYLKNLDTDDFNKLVEEYIGDIFDYIKLLQYTKNMK